MLLLQRGKLILFWFFVIFMIIMYPILISIYVTLPLFIGFSGYIFVRALENEINKRYLFLALLYIFNLEISLSLPIFMIILSVLIFDVVVYPYRKYIKMCQICVALLSVIFINLIYFGLILIYDFIFYTETIEVNSILYISLIIDMIMVNL
jgi:hypothetical protein